MDITVEVAVAKTHKHASRESGDTVEVVERPGGGLSAVLVDGQGTGRGARDISQLLVGRAVAMIKDGVRDGAVARALDDTLRAQRHGQVSAALDIVSVDLDAGEVIITRQGAAAGSVVHGDWTEELRGESPPLGRYVRSRPDTWQYPLEAGMIVAVGSDGVSGAGRKAGMPSFSPAEVIIGLDPTTSAADLADRILAECLRRDGGHPGDDTSVVVLRLAPTDSPTLTRRLAVSLPVR